MVEEEGEDPQQDVVGRAVDHQAVVAVVTEDVEEVEVDVMVAVVEEVEDAAVDVEVVAAEDAEQE